MVVCFDATEPVSYRLKLENYEPELTSPQVNYFRHVNYGNGKLTIIAS